jgi:two-component system OmpR family sensor kinase
MGKLFISLYAYILITIFVLSGALDKLWPENEAAQSVPLAHEFSRALEKMSDTTQGVSTIKNLYNGELIATRDLVLPQEQQTALAQGKVVVLYDGSQYATWYIRYSDSQLLKLGPYHIDRGGYESMWPFFIMLAFIGLPVAIWSYFLWRDYNAIQLACETMEKPEDLVITSHSGSMLLPITDTLSAMQQRIKTLLDSQRELTSSVSHEFRTPLARLKFALAMLNEETPHTDRALNYYQNMAKDINELEALVSEMLEYAKMEQGKLALSSEPHDLIEILDNLIEKLGFNSAVALSLRCPDEVMLNIDFYLIERALQNLIGNAIKYAKQQVVISVHVNEQVNIIIEDDGPGIEEQYWDSIFAPFTRVDKSRNKQIKGYGLGLAIVDKIISAHGGRCTIEHGELNGACFRVTLNNSVSS